ncbi:MAG TPA: hypothetical protein ENI80_06400 [Acidiferrobacteraceae bacterium]|nr:hypothetical protein [Acidiferrobacteraceae bacterium]
MVQQLRSICKWVRPVWGMVATLGLLTVIQPASGQALLAEYSADVAAAPLLLAPQKTHLVQPNWASHLSFRAQDAIGDHALDPLGLSGYAMGGGLAKRLRFGSYSVVGALGYEFRQSFLAKEAYSQRHALTLGPAFSFTPRSTTHIYYRVSQARYVDDLLDSEIGFGNQDSHGAGLTQTWHFLQRRGRLQLGYEIGANEYTDENLHSESQRLNLSGRVPLFWGIRADFEAGYSRHIYPEYLGAGDQESYRKQFKAGLSGSFGDKFEAAISYRRADEEADVDALSYSREVWGINFRYTY